MPPAATTPAGYGAPLPPSGSSRESAATLATQKRDSQLAQEARLTAERNEARRAAARARAEQAQSGKAANGDGAPPPAAPTPADSVDQPLSSVIRSHDGLRTGAGDGVAAGDGAPLPPAAEKPATEVEASDEGRRKLARGNMAARSLLRAYRVKAAAKRIAAGYGAPPPVAPTPADSVDQPPTLEIPSHDGVRTALDSPLAQARPRLGSGSSDRSTEIGLSPSGLSMSSPGASSPSRSRSGSVSPLSVFSAAPEPVNVKRTHESPAAQALLKGAQEDQDKGQVHTSTAKATAAGDGAPVPPSGSSRENAATLAIQKRDSQLAQEARLTAERNEARRAAARARAEQAQSGKAANGDGAPPPAAAPVEGRRKLALGNMAARSLLRAYRVKAAARRIAAGDEAPLPPAAPTPADSVDQPPSSVIRSHDGLRTVPDSPLTQPRPSLLSVSSDPSTQIGESLQGVNRGASSASSPSRSGSVSPLSVFPTAPEPVNVKRTHESPAAQALLKGAQEDQDKGQVHTSTAKNLVASGKFSDAIFQYSRANWYFSSAAIQVKHSSSSDSVARVEELEKQASRAKQLMKLASQNVIDQDKRRLVISKVRREAEQSFGSMKDGNVQSIVAQGSQLFGAAAAQDALGEPAKAAESYAKAAVFYRAAAKKYAPADTQGLVYEAQAKQAEDEVERFLNTPKHPEP